MLGFFFFAWIIQKLSCKSFSKKNGRIGLYNKPINSIFWLIFKDNLSAHWTMVESIILPLRLGWVNIISIVWAFPFVFFSSETKLDTSHKPRIARCSFCNCVVLHTDKLFILIQKCWQSAFCFYRAQVLS